MKPSPIALMALLVLGLSACGSTSTGTGGTGGAGATGGGGAGGTGGTATGGGTTGGGGSGGCHSQAECDGDEFCVAYTLPPLCGGIEDTTFDENCATDADCAAMGADQICDDTLCVFPHGGAQTPLHCRLGCTADPDCGPGLACTVAHHCEPAPCTQPADCGANFSCESDACTPKLCTIDAECGDYCVNGACSATIGVCQPAVP